jgi:hypothetical protein
MVRFHGCAGKRTLGSHAGSESPRADRARERTRRSRRSLDGCRGPATTLRRGSRRSPPDTARSLEGRSRRLLGGHRMRDRNATGGHCARCSGRQAAHLQPPVGSLVGQASGDRDNVDRTSVLLGHEATVMWPTNNPLSHYRKYRVLRFRCQENGCSMPEGHCLMAL